MHKDDERWRSIAKGVQRFKPAKRLELSTIDDTSVEDDEESQSLPQLLISDKARANKEVQALPTLPSEEEVAISRAPPIRKRVHEDNPEGETSAGKRTKCYSFSRTKQGINPAFKNPLPGYLKVSKEQGTTSRPRTAPDARVLVPATTSPKPRRSASDSVVQPKLQFQHFTATDVVAETSFLESSFSVTDSLEARPLNLPETSSTSGILGVNKFPGNQEQLAAETRNRDELEDTQAPLEDSQPLVIRLSQASIDEDELICGTQRPTMSVEYSTEIEGRTSSDLTNLQGQPLTSDSTENDGSFASSDTATQSDQYYDQDSPLASRSGTQASMNKKTIEDRMSEQKTPDRAVTRREVLGPVSSPVLAPAGPDVNETPQIASRNVGFDTIGNLPRRIKCQVNDTNYNKQHNSYIPDYLRQMAQQHDLANHFRPLQAPKSLLNEERGYWKLLIRISDSRIVANSRRSPMSGSQWSEKRFKLRNVGNTDANATTQDCDAALRKTTFPAKDPKEHVLWTADEFISFWKYIEKTVLRGRAGYDSRATITSLEEVNQDLLLDVRLWCYAEALSHIWLLLFGLSHGLTAQMPIQWNVPGEGTAITMCGQLKYDGTLKRWEELAHGVDGSWGTEVN